MQARVMMGLLVGQGNNEEASNVHREILMNAIRISGGPRPNGTSTLAASVGW